MVERSVETSGDKRSEEDCRREVRDLRERLSRLSAELHDQQASLDAAQRSMAWRLCNPLRALNGFVNGRLLRTTKVDIEPVRGQQPAPHGQGQSSGTSHNGAQFLLRPLRPAVLRRPGWVSLEYVIRGVDPAEQRLLVDYGNGLVQQEATLGHDVESGRVQMFLELRAGFREMRLDVCSAALEFGIERARVRRLPGRPTVGSAASGSSAEDLVSIGGGVSVRPLHHLEKLAGTEGRWHSQGNDPYFLLRFGDDESLAAGWRRVNLVIRSANSGSTAKLYFDDGSGFREGNTLVLPFHSGERVSRVWHLNEAAAQVRFDPQEVPGEFEIEHLQFEEIDDEAARQEMLEDLLAQHPRYAGQCVAQVWGAVGEEAADRRVGVAEQLAARYGELFERRREVFSQDAMHAQFVEWMRTVESPGLPTTGDVAHWVESAESLPLFSVIVPVFNTDEDQLQACIESVLAQSYPRWELCIADDASTHDHVGRTLRDYRDRDERVRVVFRQSNGRIAHASNSALEIASGTHVVLLDHDDLLSEHALFFMARAVVDYPEAALFYSDEDKVDLQGNRFEPHFKGDWNPDLLFSQNYVSHLSVFRRDLLQRIGGFRGDVEGSQDFDLVLRCLPHLSPGRIVHVPRILYHWRASEGSTALAASEKSYTSSAGLRALADYFRDNNESTVQVEQGRLPNTYRVRWPVPQPAPLVSILIPTRDQKPVVEKAVRSILEVSDYSNFEILILDNCSVEPETLDFFHKIQKVDERVRVLSYDAPFNFSAINNFGARHAKGAVLGLVNNDIEVISPGWLTEMVSQALRPDIGCVGAKLYYPDGTLQHGGIILGIGGVAGHSHKHASRGHHGYFSRLEVVQNLSAVTAACLFVRRDVFEQAGGLDEENLPVAFNDVDFCLKVRELGYRNLWTPYAELYHHESVSRGQEDTPEKQQRFRAEVQYMRERWGATLDADPYYNENLTLQREDFSITGSGNA